VTHTSSVLKRHTISTTSQLKNAKGTHILQKNVKLPVRAALTYCKYPYIFVREEYPSTTDSSKNNNMSRNQNEQCGNTDNGNR
jgi:hypothetical protein